jgi:hypothetical protein
MVAVTQSQIRPENKGIKPKSNRYGLKNFIINRPRGNIVCMVAVRKDWP